MPWAYAKDKPWEKIHVASEQAALERGLVLETEEDEAKWSKRKKQFDNDGVQITYCPKTAARRNQRNEVSEYLHFKTVEGKRLRIPQNREGRKILQDEADRKYGVGNASVEGDF